MEQSDETGAPPGNPRAAGSRAAIVGIEHSLSGSFLCENQGHTACIPLPRLGHVGTGEEQGPHKPHDVVVFLLVHCNSPREDLDLGLERSPFAQ